MSSTYSLVKIQSATQHHGRGSDNTKTAARYHVIKDGAVVGYLGPDRSTRHYEATVWTIDNANLREVHRFYKGGKKAAMEWLEKNQAL